MIVQALQVLRFTYDSVSYRFVAGPEISVVFFADHVHASAGLTASLNLWSGPGDPTFALGVNLVAIGFLVLMINAPEAVGGENGEGRQAVPP